MVRIPHVIEVHLNCAMNFLKIIYWQH
uniref:Uncharacterized protein n=1 Tax=Anguilla anguilla TaxID=7936 RepID=A0A0E9SWP4_ANGAN